MPKIRFVEESGVIHDVEAPEGDSVMQAAVANSVPGIDADCGGACACGTCHVYVDPVWLDRIPARLPEEQAMLEFGDTVKENSRLSCQIKITAELDGLLLRLPA